MTKDELLCWFQEHRTESCRKLSVHVSVFELYLMSIFSFPLIDHCLLKVVGFGAEENKENGESRKREGKGSSEEDLSGSSYGEVSKLTFLPASPKMADATAVMDIPAFTKDLPLFPYHKVLEWTQTDSWGFKLLPDL